MKLRHVLAVATIIFALGYTVVSAAPATAATSGDFVSQINNLRAGKGLNTLVVDSRLQSQAQGWAEQMAAAGAISHNPALAHTPGNWSKVGENVGVGGSVSSLMTAFINSPEHYSNLVDPSFNSVGVGVATGSDGRLYTVHDFAAYPGVGGASGGSGTSTTGKTVTTSHASTATTAKKPVVVHHSAAASAPVATTTTTVAPAPVPAPVAPPAPVLPDPSSQIVQSLVEVGSINAQG